MLTLRNGVGALWVAIAWRAFLLGAADNELEALKAAANQCSTALEVANEGVVQEGKPYNVTRFKLDTKMVRYLLRYQSFLGANASENPRLLNDGASGYGMLQPHGYWYGNGFLDAALRTSQGLLSASQCEGGVKVLEESGQRAAFDLRFGQPGAGMVLRTAALAGRGELFVELRGKAEARFTLSATFHGYPLGFNAPFDRCVHTAAGETGNSGTNYVTTALDPSKSQWLLLTDHKLNADGKRSGQLGLVFRRAGVKSLRVTHGGNYVINVDFVGGEDVGALDFIVCDFDVMTIKGAEDKLAVLAKDSDGLFKRAFDGLPE